MPLTVLVVDDDPGTRLFTGDYLELVGYLVVSAENGQQALQMVDEYQPHLMVTDVTMPQLDGYELVRQVRRKPAFRLLPVVFLTARSTTDERIRGYQSGGDVYLAKPFEVEELGAVVRNLLERSQLIQSDWRGRPAHELAAAEQVPHLNGSAFAQPTPAPVPPFALDLTGREASVLQLLLDGLSNGQIGDRLHLSSRTVEKYVSSLLRKTETSNRAELVRFAMEHHLVSS